MEPINISNIVKTDNLIYINNETIISFINTAQNGDIFISSKFVWDIKNKLINNNCKYYIKLSGPNTSIKSDNF
jgi:hypothetical protein